MTVIVHHGDSRLDHSLHYCVCAPMARLAECDEISEIVGGQVVVEAPIWPDVVDVSARHPAVLAKAVISGLCLSFLGRPIRASMMDRPTLELRMQFSYPIAILARASAIEAAALKYFRFWLPKNSAASLAITQVCARSALALCRVLARWRAMLPPAMLGARRGHRKLRTAVCAVTDNRSAPRGEAYNVGD